MMDKPASFSLSMFLYKPQREKERRRLMFESGDGHLQLFVSREVLAEIEDVLNRPQIRAHFPSLSEDLVKDRK
jgi:predicted nucleic acid-binding protein